MEVLDRKLPFGVVYGDTHIGFEQNGRMYNHKGELMRTQEIEALARKDAKVISDQVDHAVYFLKHVLKNGPLSRAVLYKAAEDANQAWEHVKSAAPVARIQIYKQASTEYWRLPEE